MTSEGCEGTEGQGVGQLAPDRFVQWTPFFSKLLHHHYRLPAIDYRQQTTKSSYYILHIILKDIKPSIYILNPTAEIKSISIKIIFYFFSIAPGI